MEPNLRPHRRFNPLTRDWVLVSPQRALRPWLGQVESAASPAEPAHDPACHLCPGNPRADGRRNPKYEGVFAFDNDFPALLPAAGEAPLHRGGLLSSAPESGRCRVLCFSPRHDLSLSRMSETEAAAVVELWVCEFKGLSAEPGTGYVQIFENRGAMMGASSPHPHGQAWSSESVPNEPAKEQAAQSQYLAEKSRCLLCSCEALERAAGERTVFSNDHFTVVVPFWAVWPYETLLLPRRHVADLAALHAEERAALGAAIRRLTAAYDRVFDAPFPYSMGFHQRPTDGQSHEEWHLHAHFFPPLLRSATVRKFMVGYELLASPQRDITAEQAAVRLRELA